jgi:alkylation response protein AidB-like acyl-CoA dehydrogenase
MDFNLTPEQQLLAETVERFLEKEYSFEARRRILRSPAGWSRAIWGKLAELGLLGVQVPEAQGGIGPDPVATLVTLTAMGKALVLEPYLSSAVIGSALVRELGADGLLPAMVRGERICVPAHGEPGARHDLSRVASTARRGGKGWILRGKKTVVAHAPAADVLLVSARTSGEVDDRSGLSLFAVPREAPGLQLSSYTTLDGQRAADVVLEDVELAAPALLGEPGGAYPALAAAFDLGVAGLCAEATGVLQATLDATLAYTKARRQFGVAIARFQALSHRMADMLIHVEQARSMGYLATLRGGDRRAISAAKVVIGQACRFVGQQAVQLHGGMGVTEEIAVSHLFKRLVAIEMSLGDTDHHLEQFIAASGA